MVRGLVPGIGVGVLLLGCGARTGGGGEGARVEAAARVEMAATRPAVVELKAAGPNAATSDSASRDLRDCVTVLGSEDREARLGAVKALRDLKFADEKAMDVLEMAMGREEKVARTGLVIGALSSAETGRTFREAVAAWGNWDGGYPVMKGLSGELAQEAMKEGKMTEGMVAATRKAVVEVLKRDIVHGLRGAKLQAIKESREIGEDLIVFAPAYAEAAMSSDSEVKESAGSALLNMGEQAAPIYAEMLGSDSDAVRGRGLNLLFQMKRDLFRNPSVARAIFPGLVMMLFDEHAKVRTDAAWMLKEIGGPAEVYGRREVGEMGRRVGTVINVLKSRMVMGAGGSGTRMMLDVLKADRDWVARTLANGIPGLGDLSPEAAAECVETLRDPEPGNRRDAARRLWELGVVSRSVGAALKASVEEGDFASREGFVLAIREARRVDEPAEGVLAEMAEAQVASVERAYARAALRRLRGK